MEELIAAWWAETVVGAFDVFGCGPEPVNQRLICYCGSACAGFVGCDVGFHEDPPAIVGETSSPG